MASLKATTVATKPFEGQKPGTSGLRKPTQTFMQPHYTENFTQCILTAMGDKLKGSTLVLAGDGRFFCEEACKKIIPICAANKVEKVLVACNAIMSTPAVSCVIREQGTSGGIILTASHNPGGKDGDFGIKFNMSHGGPAPESVTNHMFELSKSISCYQTVPDMVVNLTKPGCFPFVVDGEVFVLAVIDTVAEYTHLMQKIFDFDALKSYVSCHKVTCNSLHGVMGPYVTEILVQQLGMCPADAVKCNPLPDFGGEHPDPNLTYAAELVTLMKEGVHDLGVAFDGDGDRNMVLGKNGFFVSPCDSLAVLADNLECIPYFKRKGVSGFARSMPTSGAVDRVARGKCKEVFEVPTGWKFFCNLMDAGRICLCGEESFGTGSDHIREKDGMWAALAWLSILAARKQSVEEILTQHWKTYGRNFFTRYDYENCESSPAETMMNNLTQLIEAKTLIGKTYTGGCKEFKVQLMDNFSYCDPIDQCVSKNQGIRVIFEDGSRIIYRLSGTGSSGATIRLYIDSYESDPEKQLLDAQEMLKPLVNIALEISDLQKLTGRTAPTVIT